LIDDVVPESVLDSIIIFQNDIVFMFDKLKAAVRLRKMNEEEDDQIAAPILKLNIHEQIFFDIISSNDASACIE